MQKNTDESMALLTYTDKILLMLRDNRTLVTDASTWCFIGGPKKNKESSEQSVLRNIQEETNLSLPFLTFITTIQEADRKIHLYHATLTTDNLNNIKRGERQNLDFFTLRELKKLALESATKLFITEYQDMIEKYFKE